MALPLSPTANAALNIATPSTSFRHKPYGGKNSTHKQDDSLEDIQSSPFLANISDHLDRENVSPCKGSKQSPRIIDHRTSIENGLESSVSIPGPSSFPTKPVFHHKSSRKLLSPEKRFPVKVNSSLGSPNPARERLINFDPSSYINKGLPGPIGILEDERDSLGGEENSEVLADKVSDFDVNEEQETFADETAFSTFSVIPDMTMFSRIGHSPTKYAAMGQTQGVLGEETPRFMRKPTADDPQSPTPRRHNGPTSTQDCGNTTNLILDFTEQFNKLSGFGQENVSPGRGRLSPTKNQTVPHLFSYTQEARTPSPCRNRAQPQSSRSRMSNLLDFDIPPAPTPRSMPTITPRELESLKSAFLSEISSLKASLSGKEAEVLSLKAAVGDAEKRVGESMEQVRQENNLKEQLVLEKEAWEKRGREMEAVLRNVKQEIVRGDREREALEGRLEESEKRREAAEIMAQEAESKMAGMRAGSSTIDEGIVDGAKDHARSSTRDVEIAVEKVARELHTLYKSKHETKVAALKKSYESRWDKKVKDLETRLECISKENEELRIGRDATMSSVMPKILGSDTTDELRQQAAKDAKIIRGLEARVEGLEEEMKNIKRDNVHIRHELDQERLEKGELVAACDELLSLQESGQGNHPVVIAGVESLRGSISRASGLRAPNFASGQVNVASTQSGESRIGRVDKSKSSSVQGARPGSGLGIRPGSGLSMRSGIMSSIEKMGNYKGRAE